MVKISNLAAAIFVAQGVVFAHPGQTVAEKRAELKVRSDYIRGLEKQNLAHCAKKLTKRGLEAISERRIQTLNEIRRSKGLEQTGISKAFLIHQII